MILGINASRARSGGGKTHLVGILSEIDPRQYGFDQVHVWAFGELLDLLPNSRWLVKHCPREMRCGLPRQLMWERYGLARELSAKRCSLLYNVDAGSVCRFSPSVTMSRDMLSFEPGEMARYGWSLARLRLIALRWVQADALRAADGVIFLSKHAATVIQTVTGKLKQVAVIPHGVGEAFRAVEVPRRWPAAIERPVECLYVSNAAPYKHQWVVVEAVAELRRRGYSLNLRLVGGGKGGAQRRLNRQISISDPGNAFVFQEPFVPQARLPDYLANADLFVFASSCENMPNTLVEAMAAGVPIACSDRGPMPEVLEHGGVYFDPEKAESIAHAIESLITDRNRRERLAKNAQLRAEAFSWHRCADETFQYLQKLAANGRSV